MYITIVTVDSSVQQIVGEQSAWHGVRSGTGVRPTPCGTGSDVKHDFSFCKWSMRLISNDIVMLCNVFHLVCGLA